MINKLIIDGQNIELNEDSIIPFTYTFSQAKTHEVKFGLDNTTEVCAYAFDGCKNLTSVKFPDEITMIKRAAFRDCSRLKEVTINRGIEYIGKDAFTGCTSLSKVIFEASTPPDVYCEFPSNTICFVPDDSKYVPVEFTDIEQDGSIDYFTRTPWNQYERVDDVTSVEEGIQYYRNQWDSVADNSHITEYKNEVPIDSIEVDYENFAMENGEVAMFTYTLYPENETNHHITWEISNPTLFTITDDELDGKVEITANPDKAIYGQCKLTAYAESGVTAQATLILRRSE